MLREALAMLILETDRESYDQLRAEIRKKVLKKLNKI